MKDYSPFYSFKYFHWYLQLFSQVLIPILAAYCLWNKMQTQNMSVSHHRQVHSLNGNTRYFAPRIHHTCTCSVSFCLCLLLEYPFPSLPSQDSAQIPLTVKCATILPGKSNGLSLCATTAFHLKLHYSIL